MGRAFGVVECCHGLILFGDGRIGLALQLLAPVKEVLKLMEPITYPSRVLASRLIPRNEANATIGGHANRFPLLVLVARIAKAIAPFFGHRKVAY